MSVFALACGILGFCSLLILVKHSWADDSLPVPGKKPALENRVSKSESTEIRGRIIQYSLKDFTKALLNFGQPPVPSVKPVLASISGEAMSDNDAMLYKEIFALQERGRMDAALKKMSELSDHRLRGHVLYQRYMHPTAYTSSFDELRNWLILYADHPGAYKIYKLAESKKPDRFTGKLTQPKKSKGIARRVEPMMVAAKSYQPPESRSAAEKQKAQAVQKSVSNLVRKRDVQGALMLLREQENIGDIDVVEYDILAAKIAARFMYSGDMDSARKIAEKSAKRSGVNAPMAGWVAGLINWKLGDYKKSAQFFEMTARSPYASGWTAAGGSYWAARAHMKAGNIRQVSSWLERAMDHPRTFYGLIATRALGRDFDFNWSFPTFTKEYLEQLMENPAGARAIALIDSGQKHIAEAELLRITPKTEKMRNALLSYAGYVGLPAVAMRIGGAYEASDGVYYDAALYPKGRWKADSAYTVDPALVHAIMRQESRFDYRAESPSGARGLMQLMPATARHVARGKLKNIDMLSEPSFNIQLGEKYLNELLSERRVDGDLISLLIAYNAGPGNLSRWQRQWGDVQDPLLFIELISSGETRSYVEKVLANYWIYRMRDGHQTPTLNAIAEGKVPRYADAQHSLSFKLAAGN